MNAGRKPVKPEEVVDLDVALNQNQISNAMTVMRQDAQAEQQEALNGVFALGQAVGVAMMAKAMANFSTVAEIRAFDEINKSKSFKHIPIKGTGGVSAVAENIDEFCLMVFGRGYKAMNNSKVLLAKLGEEAYENANRLGLNRTQLRLLINLPEDTRSAVEEAMQFGDKSEVVTLIQSLANQLDEAKAKTEELKAEVTAAEERIAIRGQQRDEAEERAQGFKKLPPDGKVDALMAEATKQMNAALAEINGKFRQALLALEALEQNSGDIKDYRPLAAGLVGQLQQSIATIRDEFMLTDIIGDGTPEWMRATAGLDDEA